MRWPLPLLFSTAFLGAACGFDGGEGGNSPPDGGPVSDAPPLEKGEVDIAVASATELAEGATLAEAFISGAGAGRGTIEPVVRLAGVLHVEYDDESRPYDNTWAMHPTTPPATEFEGRGFMAPPFTSEPPGANPTFIAWFSGEVRLDAGQQRVDLVTSPNALGFVDILRADGTELVHCIQSAACLADAPAAGWYPIRMGWKRPGVSNSSLNLRWKKGSGMTGPNDNLDADTRLRTTVHQASLAGSHVTGHVEARGFSPYQNASGLDVDKPIALAWAGSLFDLPTQTNNSSHSFRSATQLRITEAGDYDFVLDAVGGTSYRLWLDGEWVSSPTAFDYIVNETNPAAETVKRTLGAGWHDVILDGFNTRDNTGEIALLMGKTGTTPAPVPLASTRPLISKAPLMATVTEDDRAMELKSEMPVAQTVTIPDIATNPPALGVDIAVTARPQLWNGMLLHVTPPGSTTRIPVVLDVSSLFTNQVQVAYASIPRSALPANTPAQGNWKIELTHPDSAALNNGNTFSKAVVNVHYAAAAGIANAPRPVAPTAMYTRMFKLDQERELRRIIADFIKPPGTDIAIRAQLCSDAAGTTCADPIAAEALAETKPKAQYVKVIVDLNSDGFGVPIVNKLTLRYHDPAR